MLNSSPLVSGLARARHASRCLCLGSPPLPLRYVLRSTPRLEVVGADIVEVAPAYDTAEVTGILAAHTAYDDVAARFEVIVAEGAGSPAEINLRAGDYVNMGLARHAALPAVVVGDIDRGGVERQVALGFAGPFHPVDVVLGLLFEERLHGRPQFAQTSIALEQFVPGLLVVGGLDELGDFLAQPGEGQGDSVLDQVRTPDAQFGPAP